MGGPVHTRDPHSDQWLPSLLPWLVHGVLIPRRSVESSQPFLDMPLTVIAYITIPAFFLLYFGHKIYFRTPWVRRIEDIDVTTGKEEADALEAMDVKPVPKNFIQRMWFWLV